jgi:tagatose 6-phosphate kinase
MGYILTVTLNTSVDTTLTIPSPLRVGETNRVDDVLKLPGGKGINVARVLQTLRVPVHVTGLAGGSTAEFIKNGLAQAGINSTFLPIAGASRTCTAVVECQSHRVTEINEPGPTITDAEAQAFLDLYETLLPGAQAVVLSGSLPRGLPDDYYALLLNRAHTASIRSILDTSDGPLHAGVEARPLLVKPNATEAGQFLGKGVRSVEDAVRAGQSMREQGAQMVAITLGADGAVLVTEMGAWLAGVTVSNFVSGVGSGDAFVAGFIAGLQHAVERGERTSITEATAVAGIVVQALVLAVACGAANTLLLGAGVVKREDVERFRRMVDVTVLE